MTIKYFSSKEYINSQISLGFFAKTGGFSGNNFTSLNCDFNSGDKKNIVFKNITHAQKKINLENKDLKIVNQIHSNQVILIDRINLNKKYEADGMITQDHNINIAVLTADCCPIFLFDDDASFISCLHTGWKGCYFNIIKNASKKIKNIQPNIKKINAVIGPCLTTTNFEVNNDLKEKFIKKDSNYKNFFIEKNQNNKSLFDMRGLIKSQLLKNDIKNIENIELDTYSNEELFYSHRRSVHNNILPTGRMINIIGFNK